MRERAELYVLGVLKDGDGGWQSRREKRKEWGTVLYFFLFLLLFTSARVHLIVKPQRPVLFLGGENPDVCLCASHSGR